jgi:hypothetical protein
LKPAYKIIIWILAAISICWLFYLLQPDPPHEDKKYTDYQKQIQEAFLYCKQNHLNSDYFFLADLGVHSGKKRLYLVDFNKKTIASRYMVSHGCGSYFWKMTLSKSNASISNKLNSHCSSVGKYKIGEKGFSNWGIGVKYLLHGLEASNSNALKRAVVLHSWSAVSDEEVYPDGTPEGWGCPAVSNNTMREIAQKIDASEKRILLEIIK